MKHIRVWLPLAAVGAGLLVACGGAPMTPGAALGEAPVVAETPSLAAAPEVAATEDALLSDIRQLVFSGRRSGEGYFSADGRRLVFQSERVEGNPFYQIFLLDLDTGETTQVSDGVGKTTCAWIHPKADKVMFASTHEDPEARADQEAELAMRASGKARRYSWDYDPDYEIYETVPGSGAYRNLTKARGYDAEGSWSPAGDKIAFASNRLAYSAPMSDEDKRRFERDPAYMMDIYIMDADGSNVRRLTEAKGYDGGPFFSPDGSHITWRRFTPDGHQAEIWTMAIDGSDKRQLTRLGAMSWAPYYHPSGDYIIFNSNLEGFQNFELYLVDVAGDKAPVRVTYTDGWDGLPVFSPAGDSLVWSAGRTADNKAQLFTAAWNDANARKLLALAPPRDAPVVAVAAPKVDLTATKAAVDAKDLEAHVRRLAGPELEGRLTGRPGEAKATAYVAKVFADLGLTPAGTDGFFQPFAFTSGVRLVEPNVLVVEVDGEGKTRPKVDEVWRPLAFSKPGSIGMSEVVFAGYGIVAPKLSDAPDEAAYDAYGDLDVKDKWVMVLRFMPEDVPAGRRLALNRYASLRFKAMEARDRGAKGLIVVSGPRSKVREQLVPLRFDAAISGAGLPAISVTDAFAEALLFRAGRDLAAAQAALDGGEVVPGFALPGTTIGGHFTLRFEESTGRNVLGRLQVGDAPSDQVVIVGAHVDHLGRGEGGDSLARADEKGQIHFGADDNASGVGGLLEIAQHLADLERRGELAGRRDILFAAWSGEELGLLGSSHFVATFGGATEAPETLAPRVAAYLNMDMIGRLRDKLVLQGIGSSDYWAKVIEKRNVVVGLPIGLSRDTYLPTDATPFYLKGVPILAAFTGVHGEYHSPRDTADTLNYEGAAKVARLMGLIAVDVSRADAPPAYIKVAPPKRGEGRRQGRVYLGTIPDYAADSAEGGATGVKLSGVANNGPAHKAGVKAGDRLVGLAGKPVDNIYDFVRVLQILKIGEEVELKVSRGGEVLTLKVTPTSRD